MSYVEGLTEHDNQSVSKNTVEIHISTFHVYLFNLMFI